MELWEKLFWLYAPAQLLTHQNLDYARDSNQLSLAFNTPITCWLHPNGLKDVELGREGKSYPARLQLILIMEKQPKKTWKWDAQKD